jgi:hypothetical protein
MRADSQQHSWSVQLMCPFLVVKQTYEADDMLCPLLLC